MKKILLGLFTASLLLIFAACGNRAEVPERSGGVSIELSSDTDTVDLIDENGKSGYTVIYSSKNDTWDDELASHVAAMFFSEGLVTVRAKSDALQPSPTKYEIIIGATSRDESAQLYSVLEGACESSDDLAWGYAVIGEKLVFAATSATAYSVGVDAFCDFIYENNFRVARDTLHIEVVSAKEQRAAYLRELYGMDGELTDEMMGVDEYVPMIGENGVYKVNPYSEPWVYPTESMHPRYLVNDTNYDTLLEMMNDPEYAHLFETVKALAKEDFNYGVFPEIPGKTARYDAMILARIEARAFMYLFTGDEIYAMEAFVGIKNAMLSLKYTTELHPDPYHGPDHVMRVAAEVYDWCYGALSEAQRWQIIAGVSTILAPQMEAGMNYPPTGMRSVSGHGTGGQFLQVWMCVAVAFYDDAPDWWSLVGGRYFEQYLPVANEICKNGWVSQGMGYGDSKLYHQLWPTFLIQSTAGERFITDDAQLSMDFVMSHMLPNGNYFETGDESRNADAGEKSSMHLYFLFAAIYNDQTSLEWAKWLSDGYTRFVYDTIDTMSPVHQICFISFVEKTEDEDESPGLINYFKAPAGVMLARDRWDGEDAIVIRMDIGDRTMANHDIYDHGSFQIYYKGLLAATSGSYHKYGTAHHQMYTQQTVSQNGLLIFNPGYASASPSYNASGDVTNFESYYYSGGQRRLNEADSLQIWLSDSYTMAQTTGAKYEYNPDGSAKYAYIEGDITRAYPAATVEFVGRRMLAVFTRDEQMPAVFITYDRIISCEASFAKTFLLHTVKEPRVDEDGKTAVITDGGGRMYLTSVFGADEIVKIGGEGKAWWINGYYGTDGEWVEGKNLTDRYHASDNAEWIWGRIELRASGEKDTEFLTVMGITDTESDKAPTVSGFKSELITGATVDRSVVAFVNTTEKYHKEFTFTTEGRGLYSYYISGIEAGTWQVFVDGVSVAFAYNGEDEGFISFVAPLGEVTLKPTDNVIGANGGRIQYVTDGGTVDGGAPFVYDTENPTDLPTNVTRGKDIFLGWYTSQNCDEATRVTKTPSEGSGKLVLYAKWFSNFLDEDFSSTSISIGSSMHTTNNGVTYQGHQKVGVSFKTTADENGVRYLEWIRGESDPLICQKSDIKNFTDVLSEEKTVSFTFSIAPNADEAPMQTQLRLIAKVDVNGNPISAAQVILFTTSEDGTVRLGTGGPVIAQLSKDTVTGIRIAVDFKNGCFKAYDDSFELIKTVAFTAPIQTGAKDTEEFMSCLTEYLWYWYAGKTENTDAALRVYGIRVQEGDEFAGKAKPQTEDIKYNTGGASLPIDAKKSFNADGSATPLPTSLEKPGYIFAGWYASADFEGEKITEAPAGTTGTFEVYAKWLEILINTDYEGVSIAVKESSTADIGGVRYNAGHGGEPKPGSSFCTETDESGNTYLKATVTDKNALITVTDDTKNYTTLKETAISLRLDIGKHADFALSSYEIRLASSGGNYGNCTLLIIDGVKGTVKLAGVEIASLTADRAVQLRITVDFAAASVTAYGADLEKIAVVPLGDVPNAKAGYTQPATWLEWQRLATNYLFYGYQTRGRHPSGTQTALTLDNFMIVDGRYYEALKSEKDS